MVVIDDLPIPDEPPRYRSLVYLIIPVWVGERLMPKQLPQEGKGAFRLLQCLIGDK